MSINGLEILDEGINVLILLLFLNLLLLGRDLRGRSLLVELAALNVGRQRRGAVG